MKKSIVAIFIFLMIINFVTPVCAVINEDKSEKIIPSLTPDNFIDNSPLMRQLAL